MSIRSLISFYFFHVLIFNPTFIAAVFISSTNKTAWPITNSLQRCGVSLPSPILELARKDFRLPLWHFDYASIEMSLTSTSVIPRLGQPVCWVQLVQLRSLLASAARLELRLVTIWQRLFNYVS